MSEQERACLVNLEVPTQNNSGDYALLESPWGWPPTGVSVYPKWDLSLWVLGQFLGVLLVES